MLPALRLSRSCHRPLVMRAFQRSYGSNSSVDAEEVKKFNAMSQQWWDPDGEFGMLQLMNPVRVRYIRDQLPQNDNETHPFKGLRMLDIGCGGGLLSEVNKGYAVCVCVHHH